MGSLTGERLDDAVLGMWSAALVAGDIGGDNGGIGPGMRRPSDVPTILIDFMLFSCEKDSKRGGSGGDIRLLISRSFFDSICTGDVDVEFEFDVVGGIIVDSVECDEVEGNVLEEFDDVLEMKMGEEYRKEEEVGIGCDDVGLSAMYIGLDR